MCAAGWANLPSLAILVNKARTSKHIEKAMSGYASNDTCCRRDALFENFNLIDIHVHLLDHCVCVVMYV